MRVSLVGTARFFSGWDWEGRALTSLVFWTRYVEEGTFHRIKFCFENDRKYQNPMICVK